MSATHNLLIQQAQTRDLMLLLGPTRPDKIELEKGLNRWADPPWFLDEEGIGAPSRTGDERKPLPKAWGLGVKPNLLTSDARRGVQVHLAGNDRIAPTRAGSRRQNSNAIVGLG